MVPLHQGHWENKNIKKISGRLWWTGNPKLGRMGRGEGDDSRLSTVGMGKSISLPPKADTTRSVDIICTTNKWPPTKSTANISQIGYLWPLFDVIRLFCKRVSIWKSILWFTRHFKGKMSWVMQTVTVQGSFYKNARNSRLTVKNGVSPKIWLVAHKDGQTWSDGETGTLSHRYKRSAGGSLWPQGTHYLAPATQFLTSYGAPEHQITDPFWREEI